MAVIREPVIEPEPVGDNVWVEIAPPHPPPNSCSFVVLSRTFGILATETDNDLEAQFSVTAVWTSPRFLRRGQSSPRASRRSLVGSLPVGR